MIKDETLETVHEAIEAVRRMMATNVRDWGLDRGDAFLWALFLGWDDEDNPDESAMGEVAERHGWDSAQVSRLRRFHAALEAIAPSPVPTSLTGETK
jgi:hypothetical protein